VQVVLERSRAVRYRTGDRAFPRGRVRKRAAAGSRPV